MLIKQMSIHNFSFHIKIDDTANKSIIQCVSQKIADRFFFFASQYSTADITYSKEKGDNFFVYINLTHKKKKKNHPSYYISY